MTERAAVEKALRESPNITAAAHQLGASRRTLQTRMRDYGIARGKPGRPRTPLPHTWRPFERLDDTAVTLSVIGVIGLGAYLLWRKFRKPTPTIVAGASGFELLGCD